MWFDSRLGVIVNSPKEARYLSGLLCSPVRRCRIAHLDRGHMTEATNDLDETLFLTGKMRHVLKKANSIITSQNVHV